MKTKKTPLDWTHELAFSTDPDRSPVVCGVDEAGRGPLAGRVYAAAVILRRERSDCETILSLDDSKKLTEKKRVALAEKIKEISLCWAVAYAEVWEIERMNILEASLLAMRRSIDSLAIPPDGALIDGNICRGFSLPARAIVGGDAKSPSIAAASILAKTARDDYCVKVMEKEFPEYGFAKHKGYGTAAHYEAVARYGLCAHHRKSFFKNGKGGIRHD